MFIFVSVSLCYDSPLHTALLGARTVIFRYSILEVFHTVVGSTVVLSYVTRVTVRSFDWPVSGYELEDLKLANDEEMDYVEDLISLPHLHEPAILHSLCKRFEKGEIYTFTANAILLAVNPFKWLPCYSQEILMEYFNTGYMKQQGIEPPNPLGPHVFAIADSAYRDMMKVSKCIEWFDSLLFVLIWPNFFNPFGNRYDFYILNLV